VGAENEDFVGAVVAGDLHFDIAHHVRPDAVLLALHLVLELCEAVFDELRRGFESAGAGGIALADHLGEHLDITAQADAHFHLAFVEQSLEMSKFVLPLT
jgi:hypothetical protein